MKGGDLGLDGKIILKRVLQKYGVRRLNDLILLKAGKDRLRGVVEIVMNFRVA